MTAPVQRRIDALDVDLPELMADLRARLVLRHELEEPALEDAFAHLAIDHPGAITYDTNWRPGGTS